jgi:hypothetical protein
MVETKRFLGRLRNAATDPGMAIAYVESNDSISVDVLARRTGELISHENFKGRDPVLVYQQRRALAKIGAFALRGAGLLEMGLTGARVGKAIRRGAISETISSVVKGGAKVLAAEIGSEMCRVTVRSLNDREAKVRAMPPIILPPQPQEKH